MDVVDEAACEVDLVILGLSVVLGRREFLDFVGFWVDCSLVALGVGLVVVVAVNLSGPIGRSGKGLWSEYRTSFE